MALNGPAPLPSLGLLFATTTADAGTFAVNGGAAGLYYGHKLAAAYGSFALNGQDATTTKDTPTGITAGPLPIFAALTLMARVKVEAMMVLDRLDFADVAGADEPGPVAKLAALPLP